MLGVISKYLFMTGNILALTVMHTGFEILTTVFRADAANTVNNFLASHLA